MTIKSLSADDLITLYETEMKEAFPPAELKPLHRLQTMLAEGNYLILAYYEKDIFLAYACFYTAAEPALLDYYAVRKVHRGGGIGTRFLQALLADRAFPQGFLVEAEDPDVAENDEALIERKRRLAFYRRNGFKDSGVRAEIFGVRYRVLTSPAVGDEHAIGQALTRCYNGMVPLDLPERHRHVRIDID